ncbi:unnamed protein product [Durusdinium trenchii]|uniref:Glycosyl hydrolase family 92 domain-containing protein n=1 Tax=Durusdinium trenchii TaxID=1381693 RepID=A0ABP0SPS5_9DINO
MPQLGQNAPAEIEDMQLFGGGGLLSTDHEESFFVLAEDLDGTRWNLHEAEACLEIQRSERMVLRLATSFISVKQAYLNYQEELKGQTWETLNSEAKGQWESLLSRIQVEFPNASRSNVFYTNLYRGMLFPRFLGETDGEGQLVHRSAYSKRIEPGQAVTDQGFWDAYRSHYPMLSLIFPDVLGKIMEGWVNAYKELGWLPTWSAYNQRAMMVGTMGDCSLADAIVQSHQGLLHGFNSTAAYEAIRQDAFKAPSFADLKRGLGRVALEDYIQRGYVPSDNLDLEMFAQYQSASLTLGYSLADACIAPAAEAMGEAHVAKALRARAQNFRQLFDVKSLFFRPKRSNGQWDGPLYPFRWGNGFTEASAAQARFDAPQEVEGLKEYVAHESTSLGRWRRNVQELYGGKRKFCQKLREMFEERKAKFEAGTYGWIHEMYEAKMLKFGLYSHNNQPVHHVLYVAQLAGCRSFAERRLRQVMKELYTLQGWIGDEDNGEMSSWYVLSSLGLFSLVPGSDELVLGSPEVKNAKLWIPGRPVLVIRADQQSNSAIYVERVTLNGKGLPDRKARAGQGALSASWRDSHDVVVGPRGRPVLRTRKTSASHRPEKSDESPRDI